jgi:3-keto-L-gulonate-6-phosphate decarboxylase
VDSKEKAEAASHKAIASVTAENQNLRAQLETALTDAEESHAAAEELAAAAANVEVHRARADEEARRRRQAENDLERVQLEQARTARRSALPVRDLGVLAALETAR